MSNEPILIVDDNPLNLKLVKRLLELEKYQALTAASAEETLYILQYFSPHLILMDLGLPGMDGLELTRKLKEDPKYKNIIILIATSYDQRGDEAKARAAGCDGYIHKPIDVQQLPQVIASYLKKYENGAGRSGKP